MRLDFNPITTIILSVRLKVRASSGGVLKVERDAAPAGVVSQPRTRAASGLRPAGHYGLPARSLADGGRLTTPEKRGPAPEGERRDGAPGGARVLARERGTQRTMVAPLGAPSPLALFVRGDEERPRSGGGETTAYPAPQRIRATKRATMDSPRNY